MNEEVPCEKHALFQKKESQRSTMEETTYTFYEQPEVIAQEVEQTVQEPSSDSQTFNPLDEMDVEEILKCGVDVKRTKIWSKLSRGQKALFFMKKRRQEKIVKFGLYDTNRSGLKNKIRQKAAGARVRDENGQFIRGGNKSVPTYCLNLPIDEGEQIFVVTRVQRG